MKFGEFFGKYTLCGLIYSAISIVMAIIAFFGLAAYGKHLENESDTSEPEALSDEE